MDSIGVVVLTHGRHEQYAELVRSLLEDGVPATAIAVVQNPTHRGDPPVAPPHEDVTVIRPEENRGYTGGMNLGIRHHLARDVELVLMLTHEVRFRRGALASLIEGSRGAASFGVLGPALWWRGEDRPFSYGGRRGRRGGLQHIVDEPKAAASNGVAACDWIDGAVMLIRAEVLRAQGPFDERFFIYLEDSELCLRAERGGWRVGVVLDAVAEQAPGGASRPGAYAYLTSRNGLEYARLAAGTAGWLGRLARHLQESPPLVRSWVRNRADLDERARCRVRLTGLWLGTLDFLRRRWGPPPALLTGLGDLQGTSSPPPA